MNNVVFTVGDRVRYIHGIGYIGQIIGISNTPNYYLVEWLVEGYPKGKWHRDKLIKIEDPNEIMKELV